MLCKGREQSLYQGICNCCRTFKALDLATMDTSVAETWSTRTAEEEADLDAFDDELLEALSEGDPDLASPEVPTIR